MTSLRYYFALLLVIAAATIAAADVEESPRGPAKTTHQVAISPDRRVDLVVGEREPGDRLVQRHYFVREPLPKRIIAFRPFDVPYEYIITQVRIVDRTAGLGGPATYEYGGPGMNRVLLGFTSEPNQGIDYAIELYGKLYE